jgi:hypothetical protein
VSLPANHSADHRNCRSSATSGLVVVNDSDGYYAACFAGLECTERQAFEFDSGYSTEGHELRRRVPSCLRVSELLSCADSDIA